MKEGCGQATGDAAYQVGEGRLGREKWGGKSGEARVGSRSGSLACRQLARVVTAPAPADESCATADHRLARPLTKSC